MDELDLGPDASNVRQNLQGPGETGMKTVLDRSGAVREHLGFTDDEDFSLCCQMDLKITVSLFLYFLWKGIGTLSKYPEVICVKIKTTCYNMTLLKLKVTHTNSAVDII